MSHEGHDSLHDMPMNSSAQSMPPKGDLMNTTHDRDTMMIMNRMSLYWGKEAIVLFSGWPDKHLGMYILALLFVFLLAVAVEILSSLSPTVKPNTSPITAGFIQSSFYAFRMGSIYLVMLSVMSFNVGIFLAAVAGHTVGFFLVQTRAHALAKRSQPKL